MVSCPFQLAPGNQLGFEDRRDPVVALPYALRHARLQHFVAAFGRFVSHGGRYFRLAILLDESDGDHGLTRIPRLVEALGGDEAFRGGDFEEGAARAHLWPWLVRQT